MAIQENNVLKYEQNQNRKKKEFEKLSYDMHFWNQKCMPYGILCLQWKQRLAAQISDMIHKQHG